MTRRHLGLEPLLSGSIVSQDPSQRTSGTLVDVL